MLVEAFLGRLVVVGHHQQAGVDADLLGLAGGLDRLGGAVRAGAGDDRCLAPTASLTSRNSRSSSGRTSVGDSPVVPTTTSPSLPEATRARASFLACSKSTSPLSLKGVTMAVITRPSSFIFSPSPVGSHLFTISGTVCKAPPRTSNAAPEPPKSPSLGLGLQRNLGDTPGPRQRGFAPLHSLSSWAPPCTGGARRTRGERGGSSRDRLRKGSGGRPGRRPAPPVSPLPSPP